MGINLQVDYESTIQTISDVMVNGVLFSCGDEHITTHCKHMEEEALHDPVKDSSGNPIVYTTLDYKFQIIEYKNHSWMCPALHVSEVRSVNIREFMSDVMCILSIFNITLSQLY